MYLVNVIIFILFGLHMVDTVKSQSCGEALVALNDDSECEEEFQAFDANTTTAYSTLCTGTCIELVNGIIFGCGEEYVSYLLTM